MLPFRRGKKEQAQSSQAQQPAQQQEQETGAGTGNESGVHTAMTFEGSSTRCEWVSRSGKEVKFEGWLSFLDSPSGEVKREPLNSYNMQRLPAESYPLKEGFFMKANQAQNSWKRRYFIVRAGLLMFFKDDPQNQPPGVAVLPQGCVPLEGVNPTLPMNFEKSFSWKPRKEVSGYEMKLEHSSRRHFLLVFPSAELRLEWCNYLSNYILHSFLSEEYKIASKIYEVEILPMYCIHQCMTSVTPSASPSSDDEKKVYLHIDWCSKDSSAWCLRISSLKLSNGHIDSFDSTKRSLSTALYLRRIAHIELMEISNQPDKRSLRHSATPPILRTEHATLPRKPTFDFEQQDSDAENETVEHKMDMRSNISEISNNPCLVIHELSSGPSSKETICNRFYPIDGNSAIVRQWYDAIQAALKLQKANAEILASPLNDSSTRPGMGSPSGSSRSVLDMQNKLKLEKSNASNEQSNANAVAVSYSREDFLVENNELESTHKNLEYLSSAAESGPESGKSAGKRKNHISLSSDGDGKDITFVTSPQNSKGKKDFSLLKESFPPKQKAVKDNKSANNVTRNEIKNDELPMQQYQQVESNECNEPSRHTQQKSDLFESQDRTLSPRMWLKMNKEESVRSDVADDDSHQQSIEIKALTQSTFLDGSQPASLLLDKSDDKYIGDVSDNSTNSCRGRVIVTKKGREQALYGSGDVSKGRKPFSRLERSLGRMNSKRKKRLSTVIATPPKSFSAGDEKVTLHLARENLLYIDESPTSMIVEYHKIHSNDSISSIYFHLSLAHRSLEVSKIVLNCDNNKYSRKKISETYDSIRIDHKLSSKSISLADVMSAEVDLNGTGLMRLWLQLRGNQQFNFSSDFPSENLSREENLKSAGHSKAEESSPSVLVVWTVKALSGNEVVLPWMKKLKLLKNREKDEALL